MNQSNEQYKALRARANEEGDAMAKAFEESHQAYAGGDGALAKELSNKGKKLNGGRQFPTSQTYRSQNYVPHKEAADDTAVNPCDKRWHHFRWERCRGWMLHKTSGRCVRCRRSVERNVGDWLLI